MFRWNSPIVLVAIVMVPVEVEVEVEVVVVVRGGKWPGTVVTVTHSVWDRVWETKQRSGNERGDGTFDGVVKLETKK